MSVSYDISDAYTYDREVRGLTKFLKAFKNYKGIVITWDTEKTIEEDGIMIEVIPIWKWLLG